MLTPVGVPPVANAAVCVPPDAPLFLAKFKLSPSAQAEPFHSSETATVPGVAPPATRQPVSVGAPSPVKKEAVVDDDDALSYFASLANDD